MNTSFSSTLNEPIMKTTDQYILPPPVVGLVFVPDLARLGIVYARPRSGLPA